MTIDTIMTRHIVTVAMDDSLKTVQEALTRHKIHHLIVTEHHKVVGVLSDRDLLANLSCFVGKASERTLDSASLNRRVHQIMTRKLISAKPTTPVREAANLILSHGISCLPVLGEDGRCLGIVTWRDVLRWAFADANAHRLCEGPMKTAA